MGTRAGMLLPVAPCAEPVASPVDLCVSGLVGEGPSDWPGRLSATVLMGGCDFRCPYCHSPELLAVPRHPVSLESALEYLRSNRAHGIEGVVLTGGEPTASAGIRDILRAFRAEGLPVKIDTNGSAPATLESLIGEGLVEFIALDVKTTPERYDLVTHSSGAWGAVRRSIELIISSGIEHEFRTTCYPLAIPTADLPRLASHLRGGQRFAIQQFRPARTLDPGAGTVRPYPAELLRHASLCCAVHLPTVVRGV